MSTKKSIKKSELIEQVAKLEAKNEELTKKLEALTTPKTLRLPAGFTRIEIGEKNLVMDMAGGATVRWGTKPDGKLYDKPYIKGAQFFQVTLRCASVLARMGETEWAARFQRARELEKQNLFANQFANQPSAKGQKTLEFDNSVDVPGHIDEPLF